MKKIKLVLRISRLIFYIALFLTFAIIPTSHFLNHTICAVKTITGYDCPTCGVTRSFSSIMHFKFIDAFHYNNAFLLIIFPISLIIILNDIYNIIIEFIFKKETCSYLEHLFKL